MNETLLILGRTAAIFVTVLIIARLLGKREVSQLSFFDFILATAIGSMAADIAVNPDLSFFPAGFGMFVWALLGFIVGVLSVHHRTVRIVTEGRPTVVIAEGRIFKERLQKLHYNLDALRMQLRNQGVFSVADVEFAVLETNGQLSVLKKVQSLPVTPQQMELPVEPSAPPLALIVKGRVRSENLQHLEQTSEWLHNLLDEKGLSLEDVYYAEGDRNGITYVQERK